MLNLSNILDQMNIDKDLQIDLRLELAIKTDPKTFFSLCENSQRILTIFNHAQSVLIYSYFTNNLKQSDTEYLSSIVKSVSYKFHPDKFNIFCTFFKFDLSKDHLVFLLDIYVSFFMTHYQSQPDFLTENLAKLPFEFQKQFLSKIKDRISDKTLFDRLNSYINLYNF